jgi:hypothetical protein
LEIQGSDLPEVSKSRLLSALRNPPDKTYLINESKIHWAVFGAVATGLTLWAVVAAADSYKWRSVDQLWYLAIVIVSFIFGWYSVLYLFNWFRCDFKAQVLVNPLYFLRFRFNQIEVISFTGERAWDIRHTKDSKGAYSGTKFYFRSEGGQQKIVRINSIQAANALVEGLNSFPEYLSSLVQQKDVKALYLFDLLFEWRRREEEFPQVSRQSLSGFSFILNTCGPSVLAGIVAIAGFFLAIQPYNNHCDDELRWKAAVSSAKANAYRIYLASRPDGRHVSDAHAAIDELYERAENAYRDAAGNSSPEGVEAVIKMLKYANGTEHYKVRVEFAGENQIPLDVEARLKRATGLSRLVPVLPSFTEERNQERENRILQKITESFGKVIPGDILNFEAGHASPQDITLKIHYNIQASGEMYYPEKQEHISLANRDWYTGIGFDWTCFISVPGQKSTDFQLALNSKPAQLFQVAYQRSSSDQGELEAEEVYSAMADSAFEDFETKLVSQLAVR